jgi:hypothetical protein
MSNAQNQVKVYAVIGGWDYEGESFDSLCIFDCKSAAEAYAKKLEEGDFDYALIDTKEVKMETAIAA